MERGREQHFGYEGKLRALETVGPTVPGGYQPTGDISDSRDISESRAQAAARVSVDPARVRRR